MRDAFGGAFMVKLILVFLAVYVAFVAIAINYAKAFRVKNQIINYVEQYGYGNSTQAKTNELISSYLTKMSYTAMVNINTSNTRCENSQSSRVPYCIVKHTETNGGITSVYYTVITYMEFNLPFLGSFVNGGVPISGETRPFVCSNC